MILDGRKWGQSVRVFSSEGVQKAVPMGDTAAVHSGRSYRAHRAGTRHTNPLSPSCDRRLYLWESLYHLSSDGLPEPLWGSGKWCSFKVVFYSESENWKPSDRRDLKGKALECVSRHTQAVVSGGTACVTWTELHGDSITWM